jgi:aspartate aminotransferase-like enzyme
MIAHSPLLDLPPFPASGFAELADRTARLLHTRNDVLLVQGEAIIALEAAATSIARPGLSALNIVTSPYGALFGGWLRRAGAEVKDLVAEPGKPITADAVAEALAASPVGLVSLVHAESATGILNPLEAIAPLAKAQGALLIVDAVASAGGHLLDVDALGIDICVTGPQKSFSGSAGVSMLSVSAPAWEAIERRDGPRDSILSLRDHRRLWLEPGRGALPGMPSSLEFWALAAAMDRVEEEGLDRVIARHARAARAARAGVVALGLVPWVQAASASNLVTAAPLPAGILADTVAAGTATLDPSLQAGVGPVGQSLLRINHTGQRARLSPVMSSLAALGQALRELGHDSDTAAAIDAALAAAGDGD